MNSATKPDMLEMLSAPDLKTQISALTARVKELEEEKVSGFIPYPCPKCVRNNEYNMIRWDHVGVLSMSSQWWYKIEGECPVCETLFLLDVPNLNQRSRDYERNASGVNIPGSEIVVEEVLDES